LLASGRSGTANVAAGARVGLAGVDVADGVGSALGNKSVAALGEGSGVVGEQAAPTRATATSMAPSGPTGTRRRSDRASRLSDRARPASITSRYAPTDRADRGWCDAPRHAGVHHRQMESAPLRVIIAEDSALIREGIARLIQESGGTVVAKVGDGPSFVDAVVIHRPDVSVVDVRMPPTQRDEGLRAAIEARRRVPGTPVLVLSQYVERQYATELLADRAGGVGYLLKDRVGDIREFMDALRRVARGGTALDPEVVAQLMVRHRADDPLSALTPREREVLAAMAEGRTNVGIAELLSITEGATEKHITNIFGKLELPDSQNDHRRVLAVLTYLGS
jgi:DNA-binding NarL/FixJ family response regulator